MDKFGVFGGIYRKRIMDLWIMHGQKTTGNSEKKLNIINIFFFSCDSIKNII